MKTSLMIVLCLPVLYCSCQTQGLKLSAELMLPDEDPAGDTVFQPRGIPLQKTAAVKEARRTLPRYADPLNLKSRKIFKEPLPDLPGPRRFKPGEKDTAAVSGSMRPRGTDDAT